MTRPRDIGHAVHQHYTSQADTGRTRNNQASAWGSQDNLRALAAQVEADPTLADALTQQQRHAIARIKLTDANRAKQNNDTIGDDAA